MKIKNKKGAEKIISVYWFVILFMVAGTIAYSVSIFYGNPYDVREIESNIMINKIADCLSENGKLKEGVLSEDFKENFLEKCNLNFGNDKDEYYIEIEFYDFENPEEALKFNINKGNINLKNSIEYASNSIFINEKSFYVLNEKEEISEDDENQETEKKSIQINERELIVKITSIIRKTHENVG
jgi:hypothetical protein